MFERFRNAFSTNRDAAVERALERLRHETPVPVFWLFGKTQSGKTSIIHTLTGAADAEIGNGFRPCTRTSRRYDFPTAETPLLEFLDTRGLDESGYDASEDLAALDPQAHLVLVTVKLLDHAIDHVLRELHRVRDARPTRPVILAVTCLHEAYPQEQHPAYRYHESPDQWPEAVRRPLQLQIERFGNMVDLVVPIDLTPDAEGYEQPQYGAEWLKAALLDKLPHAYRQTLLTLDVATRELKDLHRQKAQPYILAYSGLAATAGGIPIPWVDLLLLPGIQSRMITHLAQLYGQPLSGARFLEVATTLGIGLMARQAIREIVKIIPGVGSVAGAALAGASTYALGQAFCHYYEAVHGGHAPSAEELRRYYREQLASAERFWATTHPARETPP